MKFPQASFVAKQIIQGGRLRRFLPEPKTQLGSQFQRFMNGVGKSAGAAVGSVTGIDSEYLELLNKQIEVQKQMQLISFHSNIEKTRHETQMAAIRNIRTT